MMILKKQMTVYIVILKAISLQLPHNKLCLITQQVLYYIIFHKVIIRIKYGVPLQFLNSSLKHLVKGVTSLNFLIQKEKCYQYRQYIKIRYKIDSCFIYFEHNINCILNFFVFQHIYFVQHLLVQFNIVYVICQMMSIGMQAPCYSMHYNLISITIKLLEICQRPL